MIEKGILLTVLGILVIPIEALLGTHDTILTLLLFAMGLDLFTGVLKAIYTKQLSSKIGYKGFIRKIGIFAAVAVAHIIDQILGTDSGTFRNLTVIFYISLESLSIIENLAIMDILIPSFIKDKLKQINTSTGNGDKSPLIAQSAKIEVVEAANGNSVLKIEEAVINNGENNEKPSEPINN
jgi:toxin secretion/phage lysis holin